MRRAYARKTRFGRGARQQRGHGGHHARGAVFAAPGHHHLDAAALGQLAIGIQMPQPLDHHEIGPRHRRARMPGQPHRIHIPVGDDAASGSPQKLRQRVM